MQPEHNLHCILSEGEGQRIELKQGLSGIDREMVGMANAVGGSIYLGITDEGEIVGFEASNTKLSEIQTIARNCDPSIQIQTIRHDSAIEIAVQEGADKPYRCRGGFFLRQGANTQKLKRDEIRDLIAASSRFHFDDSPCQGFAYPADFSEDRFKRFLQEAEIRHRARWSEETLPPLPSSPHQQ